jgi:hypothetical protein
MRLTRVEEQWWAEQFALDGLSEDRILVVRRAAEGLAAALAFGEESPDSVQVGRDLLLSLTQGGMFRE